MVFSDDTGRRIRVRVKRSTSPADRLPDDPTRLIRQLAAANPTWTPDELHALIHASLGRRDVTMQMVRAVLGSQRTV